MASSSSTPAVAISTSEEGASRRKGKQAVRGPIVDDSDSVGDSDEPMDAPMLLKTRKRLRSEHSRSLSGSEEDWESDGQLNALPFPSHRSVKRARFSSRSPASTSASHIVPPKSHSNHSSRDIPFSIRKVLDLNDGPLAQTSASSSGPLTAPAGDSSTYPQGLGPSFVRYTPNHSPATSSKRQHLVPWSRSLPQPVASNSHGPPTPNGPNFPHFLGNPQSNAISHQRYSLAGGSSLSSPENPGLVPRSHHEITSPLQIQTNPGSGPVRIRRPGQGNGPRSGEI